MWLFHHHTIFALHRKVQESYYRYHMLYTKITKVNMWLCMHLYIFANWLRNNTDHTISRISTGDEILCIWINIMKRKDQLVQTKMQHSIKNTSVHSKNMSAFGGIISVGIYIISPRCNHHCWHLSTGEMCCRHNPRTTTRKTACSDATP